MATNTTYNPKTLAEFTKDSLEYAGDSIFLEALEGTTTEADLTLTDDHLLTGGSLLVENGSIGDQMFLQIVHPVYGVVKQFVKNFRMAKDSVKQIDLQIDYPSKLVAGLSIRCKYIAASGGLTRNVAVNFYLHKVLE